MGARIPVRLVAALSLTSVACYEGVSPSAGDDALTTMSSGGGPTAGDTEPSTTAPTGAESEGPDTESTGPGEPDAIPLYPIRRLTNREYSASVRDVFLEPDDPDSAIRQWFPLPLLEPDDVFSNNAGGLIVGAGTFGEYVGAAENFSVRIARTRGLESFVDCEGVETDVCVDRFIWDRGERLFRRPLLDAEHAELMAVYDDVLESLDHEAAFGSLIAAMILSPQTLYLLESPDPSLRPWHVASRLSYLLWGAPPDDALLEKARDGSIVNPEVLRAEADRMIDDERFTQAFGLFYSELLGLSRFEHYYKDLSLDGVVTREGMMEDFRASIRRQYDEDGTLHTLLTDEQEFVDPAMVDYYDGEYPGILSHPVFTWTHAGYRSTSPVERGVTVRERLILCDNLPPPPMDVSAIPDNVDEDQTMRERLAAHREDPACAGCHELIDPLGLAFEGYDWNGLFRSTENGQPVDASGAVTGAGDEDSEVDGLLELGTRLAELESVQQCFVDQTLRFSVLRQLDELDGPLRSELMNQFQAEGLSLRALLLAIATSEVVLFTTEEEE